jgi:hypothetical protein
MCMFIWTILHSALPCSWNGLTCVVFPEIETQRHRFLLSSRYNGNTRVVFFGRSASGNQLPGFHPSSFISACNTYIGTETYTSDRIVDSIEENKYLNWLRMRKMHVDGANQFHCHGNLPIHGLSVHTRGECDLLVSFLFTHKCPRYEVAHS